jgi:hypothetical protein
VDANLRGAKDVMVMIPSARRALLGARRRLKSVAREGAETRMARKTLMKRWLWKMRRHERRSKNKRNIA